MKKLAIILTAFVTMTGSVMASNVPYVMQQIVTYDDGEKKRFINRRYYKGYEQKTPIYHTHNVCDENAQRKNHWERRDRKRDFKVIDEFRTKFKNHVETWAAFERGELKLDSKQELLLKITEALFQKEVDDIEHSLRYLKSNYSFTCIRLNRGGK